MSQRDIGFHGGIQPGQTTLDDLALELDSNVRKASIELADDPDIKKAGLYRTRCFTEAEAGGGREIRPDGGVWRIVEKIVAVIEAKKQNEHGNVHNRFYRELRYAERNNPDVKFLLITAGRGETGTLLTELLAELDFEKKGKNSLNVYHPKGCSFFTSEHGYTKNKIKEIIKNLLLGRNDCIFPDKTETTPIWNMFFSLGDKND